MIPRWLRAVVVSLVAIVAVAVLVLYGASEYILRRRYPVTGRPLAFPTDSTVLEAGRHMVTLRGCLGCHGAGGEGQVFFNEPSIATIVAPNLTRALSTYSAIELDGIIRHGVRPSGQSVLGMPSEAFTRLRDDDLAAIIAFIRSIPPAEGPGPGVSVGPLGRLGLITGKFKVAATLVAEVDRVPLAVPPDSLADGSYLAHTICTECHGPNLEGDPAFKVPPISIAASYSWSDFETLMRTGKARGERELNLMSEVARVRFSQFTPVEMQALFAYLQTLGANGA